MTAEVHLLTVRADAPGAPLGWLEGPTGRLRCTLGRAGVVADKREGDGGTPTGRMALGPVLYRPDRVPMPRTGLSVRPLRPLDGWCEDPAHPAYNLPVTLPHPAAHESMWRADGLYDVVCVLGHNDSPPVPGRGSAIFLHVARPDLGPTAGCVGLPLDALTALLARCATGSALVVEPPA